jgi:ABC-type glycerol-3-phosphate transport system substrate-binding protein
MSLLSICRSTKPSNHRIRTADMTANFSQLRRLVRFLTLFGLGCVLLGLGCERQPSQRATQTTDPPTQVPLRLLVIDDKPLGEAISRQWQSRTENQIELRYATGEEIASARRLPADVVVFPSALLGTLAESGLISPLGEDAALNAQFAPRELLDQVRSSEIRWGRRIAAVPLGSPQYLLLYDVDQFDRLRLQPPATWYEYQAVSEKLASSEGAKPTLEPLATGWAGQTLLARAATHVTHRDQIAALFDPQSMVPLIDQLPYVRALDELVAATALASLETTPTDVFLRVQMGEAAMGLGFPSAVTAARARESNEDAAEVGFGVLPGSPDVFDFALKQWDKRSTQEESGASLVGISGRQAAVTSSANQTQAAANFVVWLSAEEISSRTSPSSPSTSPFRKSQLPSTGRWFGLSPVEGRSCATAIEQSLHQKNVLAVPRIPGQAEYLAALDQAVQSVVKQEKASAEALQMAAKAWEAITDKFGRDQQRLAYRRSLNLADWP